MLWFWAQELSWGDFPITFSNIRSKVVSNDNMLHFHLGAGAGAGTFLLKKNFQNYLFKNKNIFEKYFNKKSKIKI